MQKIIARSVYASAFLSNNEQGTDSVQHHILSWLYCKDVQRKRVLFSLEAYTLSNLG